MVDPTFHKMPPPAAVGKATSKAPLVGAHAPPPPPKRPHLEAAAATAEGGGSSIAEDRAKWIWRRVAQAAKAAAEKKYYDDVAEQEAELAYAEYVAAWERWQMATAESEQAMEVQHLWEFESVTVRPPTEDEQVALLVSLGGAPGWEGSRVVRRLQQQAELQAKSEAEALHVSNVTQGSASSSSRDGTVSYPEGNPAGEAALNGMPQWHLLDVDNAAEAASGGEAAPEGEPPGAR